MNIGVSVATLFYALAVVNLQTCAGDQNITAQLGGEITLPCHRPTNGTFIAVEWRRRDLTDPIFFYMDGKHHPRQEHESFHCRVDLVRRQMNGSDVSLVLKNVSSNDSGIYECRVEEKDGRRRMMRSVILSPPVNTVMLMIDKSGRLGGDLNPEGHVWLVAGLAVGGVLLLLGAVAYGIYRTRCRGHQQGPYHSPIAMN